MLAAPFLWEGLTAVATLVLAGGQRFYLLDSQSLSEWKLIADSGNYASRVTGFVTGLVDDESEHADG